MGVNDLLNSRIPEEEDEEEEEDTLTTVLQFSGFVWNNQDEPRQEETFTHSHLSWSSVIPYLLPPSTTIHSILPVQFTCLTVFFHNLSKFSLVYFLAWHPQLHTPYIFSPKHFLLFATHAHTIATCFAAVPRLYHLILVSLSFSLLLGTLSCSLMPHLGLVL